MVHKGKKIGDKPEYLTPSELDKIENVVSGDLFFTTLYKALRYSGRRVGELVGTVHIIYDKSVLTGGIRLKDIDFDKNEMKTVILKTKKRKLKLECEKCNNQANYKNKFCPECGAKMPEFDKEKLKYSLPEEITIPMRDELPIILKTYIENYKPKLKTNDYLFRKYSLSFLKKKIKEHCRKASIDKKFSLHGYRHCFITNLKKAGLTNEQIALWTGHKSLQTIQLYTHMVPDDVRDKVMQANL